MQAKATLGDSICTAFPGLYHLVSLNVPSAHLAALLLVTKPRVGFCQQSHEDRIMAGCTGQTTVLYPWHKPYIPQACERHTNLPCLYRAVHVHALG